MHHTLNRAASRLFLLVVAAALLLNPLENLKGASEPNDLQSQLKTAVAKVTEKAAGRSIVFVLRPDINGLTATPSVVAAVRDAVIQAMSEAHLTVTDSQSVTTQLRDDNLAGNPPTPKIRELLTLANSDLLLSGAIRRTGPVYKLMLVLAGKDGALAQQLVSIDAKIFVAAHDADERTQPDDLERATKSVTDALAAPIGKLGAAAAAAGIKSVYLTVQPETKGDSGTAGFEIALFDSISAAFRADGIESKSLASIAGDGPPMHIIGVLKPTAVAKMSDLPENSAVLVASYAHRPAGRSIKLLLVTASSQVGSATLGLDEWDSAAFGPIPRLNIGVLKYAEKQLGSKVGNGECWTLANEGLISAGAQRANGYTFGRKLAKGETIVPGDIFQFTSVVLKGHNFTMMLGLPNHTAVVRRVLGPTRFEILEQNPGPVGTATIDFNDLKSGTWEAWRPQI
jgi:hypothetical protein